MMMLKNYYKELVERLMALGHTSEYAEECASAINILIDALGVACFEVEWRTGHEHMAEELVEEYLFIAKDRAG